MENFTYKSPFGDIHLTVLNGLLQKVEPGVFAPQAASSLLGDGPDAGDALTRFLDRYFAAEPADVPMERLEMAPATPFQRRCYRVFMDIPFGGTLSYGDVARMVGRPKGARAAGRAAARNPFPIFIPCHRVVRANGGLGGFSAGTKWKQSLLAHEALR